MISNAMANSITWLNMGQFQTLHLKTEYTCIVIVKLLVFVWFRLVSQSIAVYRNKSSVLEYVAGGGR